MFKRLIIVLVALLLLFGGIFGWKYLQMQKMAAMSGGPPPAAVAAETVRFDRWQPGLRSVGSLVATQGVYVSSEIAGHVRAIHFESGARVEEGAPLVSLDDAVDRAELAGLQAERRLAEIQFERAQRLLKDKTISRSEYDQARANLDSATARAASQEARIALKNIYAPFAGQLGIRQVDLGQFLAPGDQVVSLQSLDPVYVDYSLPERNLNELAIGQAVEVEVQAWPGERFAGTISAISPRIDAATRSVPVRATLQNPDERLRAGMFAEVTTQLPVRDQVLTVAEHAISYNPYGDSVFVVEEREGGLFVQRRQIVTGAVRDGRAELISGLEEGEQVVTAGHNKLRNDMPVKIDNSVELDGQVGE
ncbi:MAG TPA: efflux RND transporter periplasmic adaptor subunit [Gammaproteobacteria bacterium]